MIDFKNDWDDILKDEFKKDYYLALRKFLVEEYSNYTIFPPMTDIFNALKATSFNDVKVVILGQDPYHNIGQAHGLSFSVKNGNPPPSLVNIYKEIEAELDIKLSVRNGDLSSWAEQGVLLLNTVLTVKDGMANSHKGRGWENFTDKIISILNDKTVPIVFLLWGNNARSKKQLITNNIHLVLETVHPSPLSCYNGFIGCGHFKKTNDFLSQFTSPIKW